MNGFPDPAYSALGVRLYRGDCRDVLPQLPVNSVDAVVTDPPYGLRFMGKRWDYDVPSADTWREVLRVLKPGGHLLTFAGTRTQHRMAVAVEDAGFEIRDMIAWVYGSGFPKSLDVGKAIDKAAGVEREVITQKRHAPFQIRSTAKGEGGYTNDGRDAAKWDAYTSRETQDITAPATDAARQWDGWGTALKPALEPITVARKPLEGTVAANVQRWGTGGLNVDGCRVGTEKMPKTESSGIVISRNAAMAGPNTGRVQRGTKVGRWPANLIHDGSPEATAGFPESRSAGLYPSASKTPGVNTSFGATPQGPLYADSGSAARYFYCAKASRAERGRDNKHATVKPLALMRYLCRLVTPPGGIVLDPFAGSGSTGLAADAEGLQFVGIEVEQEYFDIAAARPSQGGFNFGPADAEAAARDLEGLA